MTQWTSLIESARGGCDDALGQIVQRFREYLLQIADREIGIGVQAKFDASDVVQISLLDAMSSMHQFSGTSEREIRAWLTKIVLHNICDQSRRYTNTLARSVDREDAASGVLATLRDELGQTPSSVMSVNEQIEELHRYLNQLPDSQRRVLELRHESGLSYAEIASQLTISEESARKIKSRATHQLRQWLLQEDGNR